ncbi:hypothetical protein [Geomonas sp.]|uniref:hypothetical protein n=1 Tax=Geomonas sp. TaxID=2651584 RepID=UPI002B45DC9F|nr:hypothetical protein [Geomonas sp.]HJV34616.1 hypothetical protein [Geomonas sp.]
MTIHRRFLVCLLLAFTSFFSRGEPLALADSSIPQSNVAGQVESRARHLMQDLQKQGFEVTDGYAKLYTIEDCTYTFDKMGLCYGNNPAAPYVTFAVKPWPGEFVDDKSNLWGPSRHGYIDIYRLDPREAIIILAQLPPPGAFFSEQTWLFTHKGSIITDSQTYYNVDTLMHGFVDIFFATVPGDDERVQSCSMLSMPNNNVVIQNQSKGSFGEIRYFIITPDGFMNKAVRQAFAGIGVQDKDVFTEQIPSDMITGLGKDSDNFTTAVRYAEPKDGGGTGTPSSIWRKNLPLVVLRVRDTRSDRQVQPYPPLQLEQRTAVDELGYKPDVGALLAEVGKKWGQPCANADCSDKAATFIDVQRYPPYTVGPLCREIGEDCLLDNWDASYQFYGPLPLDNGEIYAVAGTLGTQTGNATYVGFGVNQKSRLVGVANLSDAQLKNTAKAYQEVVNNTDKFFLYYFTRDCSGLDTLTGKNCLPISESMVPVGDYAALSVRDYIKPGTQRGPDSQSVLPSMLLQLQRPQ